MKIKLFVVLMVMAVLAFFFMTEARAVDTTEIMQGTVKEIKGNFIKITEDSNGEKIQISVDSNTVYNNIQKLADLKVGDDVQVEYQAINNKDMGITITKIKTGNEEDL